MCVRILNVVVKIKLTQLSNKIKYDTIEHY